jgi:hypothetical protein
MVEGGEVVWCGMRRRKKRRRKNKAAKNNARATLLSK